MIFWRKIELFLLFCWHCLFLGGISIRPQQANHWFKTAFVKGWVMAVLLFLFDIPWIWTCGIFSYRKKVTPLKAKKEGHGIKRAVFCNLDHNSFLIQTFRVLYLALTLVMRYASKVNVVSIYCPEWGNPKIAMSVQTQRSWWFH